MRIGKFKVTSDIVEKHSGALGKMLAKMEFVPLKVEALPWWGIYEYSGISIAFDECEQGYAAPEYIVTCIEDGEEIDVSVELISESGDKK